MPRKINKNDMIGQTHINFQGLEMTIIGWNSYREVIIEFKKTPKDRRVVSYLNFKNGSVKNRYFPNIQGVGCVGNASTQDCKYKTKKAYNVWASMILRCYNRNCNKNKSYENCSVCEEWLCFENFEKWFDKNYYEVDGEKVHLDKDILIKDNKEYSPNSCVFVPENINYLFVHERNTNKELPVGVILRKRKNGVKYLAKISIDGKEMQIKSCDTIDDAFNFYKESKENNIKRLAIKYKHQIPQKLYDRLMEYEVTYEY